MVTKFFKIFPNPLKKLLSSRKLSEVSQTTALRCGSFFEKKQKKHLCRHDKDYYYFCRSNIPVTNFNVDSRNVIKVSKNAIF